MAGAGACAALVTASYMWCTAVEACAVLLSRCGVYQVLVHASRVEAVRAGCSWCVLKSEPSVW